MDPVSALSDLEEMEDQSKTPVARFQVQCQRLQKDLQRLVCIHLSLSILLKHHRVSTDRTKIS